MMKMNQMNIYLKNKNKIIYNNEKMLPFIIGAVILGFGGAGYYFKDDILDKVDPDHERNVGQKYFGGKKLDIESIKKVKVLKENTRRK